MVQIFSFEKAPKMLCNFCAFLLQFDFSKLTYLPHILTNRAQIFTLDPSPPQLSKNHEFETSYLHGTAEAILFCLATDVCDACLFRRGSRLFFFSKVEHKSSRTYSFSSSSRTSNSTLRWKSFFDIKFLTK